VTDPTPGNRRWAFLLAVGVSDIGTGLYLPVAVLYLVDRGLGQALTGTILATAALISLPLPALVGHLVDRFGARPVLASAMWLQAASMFCYLLVTGPAMAWVAAVLGALGLRVFWSSVFALASDLAEKTSSDRFFAHTSAVASSCFALGGLTAAMLTAWGGSRVYSWAIAANMVTFLIAGGLVLVVRSRRKAPSAGAVPGRLRDVLADRSFVAFTTVGCLLALVPTSLSTLAPVYLDRDLGAPDWLPGVLLAAVTIGVGVAAAPVTALAGRTTRSRALAWCGAGLALWSGSMAAAAALPGWAVAGWVLAWVPILALTQAMQGPVSNGLVTALAPDELRGRYLAAFQYSFGLAGVVAPALLALGDWAPTAPWLVMAVAAVGAGVGMLLLGTRLPSHILRPVPANAAPENGSKVAAG
jgi:MFS family permease